MTLLETLISLVIVIFALSFLYYTVFQGGVTNLISAFIESFAHIIHVFVVCVGICFIVAVFDGNGSLEGWFYIQSFGLNMFFLWAGIILGIAAIAAYIALRVVGGFLIAIPAIFMAIGNLLSLILGGILSIFTGKRITKSNKQTSSRDKSGYKVNRKVVC